MHAGNRKEICMPVSFRGHSSFFAFDTITYFPRMCPSTPAHRTHVFDTMRLRPSSNEDASCFFCQDDTRVRSCTHRAHLRRSFHAPGYLRDARARASRISLERLDKVSFFSHSLAIISATEVSVSSCVPRRGNRRISTNIYRESIEDFHSPAISFSSRYIWGREVPVSRCRRNRKNRCMH